jgi:hypothetical protein
VSLEPRVLRGLLLGILLAGIFWAAQGPPRNKDEIPEIIVTGADVAHQAARWEQMRGRPPTPAELKSAVDGYVRNEILYREALARGLDRQDPRVRLALIQKMEMMAAGKADAQSITEEELISFYALRKDQYRTPAKLSINQIFFKQTSDAEEQATELLDQIITQEPSDSELSELGDVSMLEQVLNNVSATELEAKFGTEFTAEVLSLPEGQWSGPVRSGYGVHLVKIFDRQAGTTPEFAAVREKVESDLMYENRMASQEQGYQEIAGKYQVLINEGAEQMLRGDMQ